MGGIRRARLYGSGGWGGEGRIGKSPSGAAVLRERRNAQRYRDGARRLLAGLYSQIGDAPADIFGSLLCFRLCGARQHQQKFFAAVADKACLRYGPAPAGNQAKLRAPGFRQIQGAGLIMKQAPARRANDLVHFIVIDANQEAISHMFEQEHLAVALRELLHLSLQLLFCLFGDSQLPNRKQLGLSLALRTRRPASETFGLLTKALLGEPNSEYLCKHTTLNLLPVRGFPNGTSKIQFSRCVLTVSTDESVSCLAHEQVYHRTHFSAIESGKRRCGLKPLKPGRSSQP